MKKVLTRSFLLLMTACYPVHAKEYEVRYAETIFTQEEIKDGAIFGTGDMKEVLKK